MSEIRDPMSTIWVDIEL